MLEHLRDPLAALESLRRVLEEGGSITVIEGDHGSCYFYPETEESVKAWECLIECQTGLDCNPMIGREIYPLLKNSGFESVQVSPKIVYVDASKPDLVEGFNKKTIIAMVEGVKEQAISSGMMDKESWEKGINDLYKTTESDGVFFNSVKNIKLYEKLGYSQYKLEKVTDDLYFTYFRKNNLNWGVKNLQLNQMDNIENYLKDSEILDFQNYKIQEKALKISQNPKNQFETVKNIYEFVRDEIYHSLDVGGQHVTFKASEVLNNGQGICFAKSNLLAAMLRFLGVPTGFCYQRLTHEGGYILHGFNAVFLDDEWYRLDARGNREEVDAQFSVNGEKLAFPVSKGGEADYPGIYSKPVKSVIAAFNGAETVNELMEKLPDKL